MRYGEKKIDYPAQAGTADNEKKMLWSHNNEQYLCRTCYCTFGETKCIRSGLKARAAKFNMLTTQYQEF